MTARIAMPLAAFAMAVGATPAAASWQTSRHQTIEARIEQDFRQLGWKYDSARRAGALDWREADAIGRRLAEIDRLGARYARDCRFNQGERQRLERLIREAWFDLQTYAGKPRDRRWRDAGWQYRR